MRLERSKKQKRSKSQRDVNSLTRVIVNRAKDVVLSIHQKYVLNILNLANALILDLAWIDIHKNVASGKKQPVIVEEPVCIFTRK